MKDIFKKFIIAVITYEAKLVLKKYKPKIIAVTGSVGKTSTKEAIVAILEQEFYVRGNKKSYNSEIGVPLTVLGLQNPYFSILGWMKNILKGAGLILNNYNYPRILVLECGADKPGDIALLMQWIKPDISVVTALGDIPVHVEFFSSPEALRSEKANLLLPLTVKDKAVLNFDDETVLEMRSKTKGELITFGIGQGADVRGSGYKILLSGGVNKVPRGISFKMEYKGQAVQVKIKDTFGRQQMYACLAASASAVGYGLNFQKIGDYLSNYSAPPGRLKLIKGIKNTYILDDTYNASPVAVHAALDAMRDMPSARKIVVLGDMMELGKHTTLAHKEAGKIASEICDLLFVVGLRSKFIKEGAVENGFNLENIFEFSDSISAGAELQNQIKKGDLILIKGSQIMRMEKVVVEIMENPLDKEKLLVRQDEFWVKK